eukprot:COSAG04_NODE_515_length_13209_cov_19.059115_16_plen_73_part_00
MRLRTQNRHAVTPKMFTNRPLSLSKPARPFFRVVFLCRRRDYLSGTNREDLVAPIPARPWETGLYVMENSPR